VEKALGDAQRTFDGYRECIIASGPEPEQQDWQTRLRQAEPSLPDGLFGGS
jgi:hypothetical protein